MKYELKFITITEPKVGVNTWLIINKTIAKRISYIGKNNGIYSTGILAVLDNTTRKEWIKDIHEKIKNADKIRILKTMVSIEKKNKKEERLRLFFPKSDTKRKFYYNDTENE